MDTLKGYVEHIIHRNEDNLYTILELIVDGKAQTLVGKFEQIDEGEMIEAVGEFVKHPLYGRQLKVSSYRSLLPEDALAMQRYLGSGAIKGVGEAMAKKIVDRFGDDSFRIIEEEPERLIEIKGISDRIAREIAIQFEEKKSMREAMLFLQKFGISNNLAVKIYKQYGEEIYQVLRENPYSLAEDLEGVGFKTADEIARKAGISPASAYRLQCGLIYTLQSCMGEGHMYLPRGVLLERASHLLDQPESAVDPMIDELALLRKVSIRDLRSLREREEKSMDPMQMAVYLARSYQTETYCAANLHDLLLGLGKKNRDARDEEETIQKTVRRLEERDGLYLDDLQRQAVIEAVTNGVFILSGGPGTGKTTTVRMIIEYLRSEDHSFLLAAPTGRAAKRMQEATGYEAKTIHRLLELSGVGEGELTHFEKNEDNPLDVDAVIIDEVSMVDIYLFHALLKALSMGTRLILVGDVNQLPSVGPGQVLRDLIESERFPMVILEKIFRQAGESDIILSAHGVHKGEHIPLDTHSKDFFFLERNDADTIIRHMVTFITGKLPAYVGASAQEIQVLTPMRKGPLGVVELNRSLQQQLNPSDPSKNEVETEDYILREGDKVMQIRNDYQLEWEIKGLHGLAIARGMGVFNGDMGTLKEVDPISQTVLVLFDGERLVRYPFALLAELELAYAVTVHKSQGSEYPAVILPLLSVPPMLATRNILYTAITRARGCCVLMGDKNVAYSMIDNDKVQLRYSGFCAALRDMI